MNAENCPKCGDKLNILKSSNRQICSSCKWTNQTKNDNRELEDKKTNNTSLSEKKPIRKKQNFLDGLFSERSNNLTGRVFFLFGLVIMFFGLGYDTTVCNDNSEFSSYCFSRTHNIGLLNTRSNLVNFGGFICVSGCILFTKFKKD